MKLSLLDFNHLCNHTVQEIAVVGYDKNGTRIIQKIGFQPCDGVHIQVICWFIQKQDVRLGKKEFAKRYTGLLTTG